MSYQDSLPERRNLVLTSMAFIIYYFGEAKVISNDLKLLFINVTFEKPQILSYLAWAAIFWFCWRYWLVTKGQFNSAFSREIEDIACNDRSTTYVLSRTPFKVHLNRNTNFPVVPMYAWDKSVRFRNLKLFAEIRYSTFTQNEELKNHLNKNPQPTHVVKFDDIEGFIISSFIYTKVILLKPSFSNYLVPYLLFIAAITKALSS